MKIFDIVFDEVIRSYYVTAGVTYRFALEKFVPLINKLEFQRNPLRKSFYSRLENDILTGCVMPNITLAISISGELPAAEQVKENYLGSISKFV